MRDADYDPDRAGERYGITYKAIWDEADPFLPRPTQRRP